MAESEEFATFETCLTWIDTIVSLCRNLDQTCSKLDPSFPSEDNSGELMSYINISDYDHDNFEGVAPARGLNYENLATEYEDNFGTSGLLEIDDLTGRDGLIEGNTFSVYGHTGERGYYIQEVQEEERAKSISKPRGIVIKPKRRSDRSHENDQYLYRLESEIIKKLRVGERMCIMKNNLPKDQTDLVKFTDEFDFLLDIPFTVKPDGTNTHHLYKSSVPGVYWDRKSWIASWYVDGKRVYRSFSSRLYGFYRSKYFAIQTRLSKSDELIKLKEKNARNFYP